MPSSIHSLPWSVIAKTAVVATLSWSVPLVGGSAGQGEKAVETIVFIRHGEKLEGGFGQLNCQGLNRALALAPIIAKSFGKPDAIFAPNPSHPGAGLATSFSVLTQPSISVRGSARFPKRSDVLGRSP
jgi:hypothetical protein